MNKFEHRNGERQVPSIPGWYFFEGAKLTHRRGYVWKGLAHVEQHDGELKVFANPSWRLTRIDDFDARWWGPIIPPWEE